MVFISAPLLARQTPAGFVNACTARKVRRRVGASPRKDCVSTRPLELLDQRLVAGRVSTLRLSTDVTISERVLGHGISGQVLMGRYLDTHDVAVKTLSRKTAAGRAEVEGEVELLLSADHPHIVRLHGVYETRSECHLVTELLSGGELLTRLSQKGRFGEVEAGRVFSQMTSAVTYLHRAGIAHCDLKVDNFVFERPGSSVLKLIDFGVAQRFSAGTKLSKLCGSPPYVAPEVFSGSYDEKIDMWCLGILLYLLLTGVMPIRVRDPTALRALAPQELYFYPPLWAPLSAHVRRLVEAMLAFEPEQRPSAQDCLSHSWLRLCRPLVKPGHGSVRCCLERFVEEASPARRRYLARAAWALPQVRQEELRHKFQFLDCDFDGVISAASLKTVLKVGDAEASRLVDELDVNRDGVVTFSDFVAAVLHSAEDSDLLERSAQLSTLARLRRLRAQAQHHDASTELGDDVQEIDAVFREPANTCAPPLALPVAKVLSNLSNLAETQVDSEWGDFSRQGSDCSGPWEVDSERGEFGRQCSDCGASEDAV